MNVLWILFIVEYQNLLLSRKRMNIYSSQVTQGGLDEVILVWSKPEFRLVISG